MDLPDRLALFGLTRLPAGQLAVLRAIAARRDVHLFLLHPSAALSERIGEVVDGDAPVRRGGRTTPPQRSSTRTSCRGLTAGSRGLTP